MVKRGFDKFPKKRMGVHGSRFEFRMELAAQVPGMILEFYYLDQVALG